jgi:hypothetical protein
VDLVTIAHLVFTVLVTVGVVVIFLVVVVILVPNVDSLVALEPIRLVEQQQVVVLVQVIVDLDQVLLHVSAMLVILNQDQVQV